MVSSIVCSTLWFVLWFWFSCNVFCKFCFVFFQSTDDNMSQESNTGANKDSQEPAMYSSDVSISEVRLSFVLNMCF